MSKIELVTLLAISSIVGVLIGSRSVQNDTPPEDPPVVQEPGGGFDGRLPSGSIKQQSEPILSEMRELEVRSENINKEIEGRGLSSASESASAGRDIQADAVLPLQVEPMPKPTLEVDGVLWRTDWTEAFTEFGDKKRLVLLGFEGCGPCIQLKKTILSDPEVYSYINDHFVPVEGDIKDWGVTSAPRIVFIDPDGPTEGVPALNPPRKIEDFLTFLKENK